MTPVPTADISRAASDLFGWDDLHSSQRRGMEALIDGQDVVAIMPTGYGKSAIYQVAGAVLGGVTVVVSPLISLQTDQVAGLEGRPHAPMAVAVNSAASGRENDESWRRIEKGEATYVFLAPEQLARAETIDRLTASALALFVVDEAHCVSTWGHDFRPDYLHLGEIVERLGRPPVLALTATGSGPVRKEIVERLRLRDPVVLSRGFDRPNLLLEVVRHEGGTEKEQAVLDQIAEETAPGIVYVATRRETERYRRLIAERRPELSVADYHGGQRSAERMEVHRRFLAGDLDVVVATSAFGMGIDKPDVHFVVHADVPESLDAYYQEIGRAGRDGKDARATLHFRPDDLALSHFFASGLPSRAEIQDVVTVVSAAGKAVRRSAVSDQVALKPRNVSRLLDLLLEAGSLVEDKGGISPVSGVEAQEAAEAAREVAATRQRVERSRIEMMRGYAETRGCRRHFLLGYFGEEAPDRCGNCDTCRQPGRSRRPEGDSEVGVPSEPFASGADVVHSVWGSGTVVSTEEDRVTVFFEREGYRVLAVPDVVARGLLKPVGDGAPDATQADRATAS